MQDWRERDCFYLFATFRSCYRSMREHERPFAKLTLHLPSVSPTFDDQNWVLFRIRSYSLFEFMTINANVRFDNRLKKSSRSFFFICILYVNLTFLSELIRRNVIKKKINMFVPRKFLCTCLIDKNKTILSDLSEYCQTLIWLVFLNKPLLRIFHRDFYQMYGVSFMYYLYKKRL